MSENNKELREVFYSNEYYSINNSKDILWVSIDEDPDKEAHPNGGFEYRVIKTCDIDLNDYVDKVEENGGRDTFWEIVEERTADWGYIDCNEKGEAFLSQIKDVDIKSYLCAYDSSYAMEGYVAAIRKIGEDELAQHLSDILSEDIELENKLEEISLADQIADASSERQEPSTDAKSRENVIE